MKILIKRCSHCKQKTKFCVPTVHHLLHLCLSVFTGGFWLLPWLIIALNAKTAANCVECGTVAGVFGGFTSRAVEGSVNAKPKFGSD